jgi:hypothetical protein
MRKRKLAPTQCLKTSREIYGKEVKSLESNGIVQVGICSGENQLTSQKRGEEMKKALTVLFAVLAMTLLSIPVSTALEQTPAGSITFQTYDPAYCVIIGGVIYCW